MHSKYSMRIGGQHTFCQVYKQTNNNDQKKRTHVLAYAHIIKKEVCTTYSHSHIITIIIVNLNSGNSNISK